MVFPRGGSGIPTGFDNYLFPLGWEFDNSTRPEGCLKHNVLYQQDNSCLSVIFVNKQRIKPNMHGCQFCSKSVWCLPAFAPHDLIKVSW